MATSLQQKAGWSCAVAAGLAFALSGWALAAAPEKKVEGKKAKAAEKAKKPQSAAKEEQHSTVAKPPLPVRTITPPTITSAQIDAMMEKHLAASKVPLAPATSDIEFVRRAYLDLTGKLPTPDQVRAFCQTKASGKRAKLIEYLMNSEDYAINWAHYWRDVIKFRATNANGGQVRYNELEGWLADQFAANKPWDEIAKALITATGRNDEENAAGFLIAHEAQAVEMAGEVSRIFMGIQIQCAQCHDHPNDSWKREQFHQFAAFFDGTRVRRVGDAQAKGAQRTFEVVAVGKPRYMMPDKADPQKKIPIDPLFFLDPKAKPLPPGLTAQERREIAAALVIDQNNPWFARAFVNRVWYLLMGEGFNLPVDDMGPERETKAAEVLETLASQWAKGGYDVKWLLRTIMNTQTYQREIRSTYSETGKVAFASNAPSRLRADQILDSLHQVLGLPTGDSGGGAAGKAKGGALSKDLKGAVGKLKGMRGPGAGRMAFDALYGYDPSTPYDDVLGTIPQALYLMNSPLVNNAMKAKPNAILGHILMSTPDNRVALNHLYLQALAREPTAQELKVLKNYINRVGDRVEAFEDILWSLINSTEFVTRR